MYQNAIHVAIITQKPEYFLRFFGVSRIGIGLRRGGRGCAAGPSESVGHNPLQLAVDRAELGGSPTLEGLHSGAVESEQKAF